MKFFKPIFSALLIICISFSQCIGYGAANTIKINGVVAQIPDGMGTIQEKDDRTFVPLRFVSEFLNNEVWYMDAERFAIVNSENFVILVQDGNETLFITSKSDGSQTSIKMDTFAYIDSAEGRMYLPIRFLAEAIGYTVDWDDVTGTVTLDMKK